MGLTADGASVNRKLIKLHSDARKLTHKTTNIFSYNGRPLFFFCDPLHLLKTTRNCWASENRNLWVKNAFININYNAYFRTMVM